MRRSSAAGTTVLVAFLTWLSSVPALSQNTEDFNLPAEQRPYVMEVYPEHYAYLLSGVGEQAGMSQITSPLLWENGRTIRVCFFLEEYDYPAVKHLVAQLAQEWVRPDGANLKLD